MAVGVRGLAEGEGEGEGDEMDCEKEDELSSWAVLRSSSLSVGRQP